MKEIVSLKINVELFEMHTIASGCLGFSLILSLKRYLPAQKRPTPARFLGEFVTLLIPVYATLTWITIPKYLLITNKARVSLVKRSIIRSLNGR
jgi:hypothetical protein